MGRKDFNKGMEAGARPFEDKYRQMGKDFENFSNKMEQDIDRMKATNEAILDELDSAQKKQYYRDNTAVDIVILDKGDRETLLALLFTLAETEETVTEYQKMFIRSVKNYLEKDGDDRTPEKWTVLKNGDWSIIDTIAGVDETKAIVQAVMEYLFMGYGNHGEYLKEYEDMFECFNLNKKGFREISANIDNIYRATGLQGLAENYGYVAEESIEQEEQYGARGKLQELKITEALQIADGETKVFENKKIAIANKVSLGKNAKLLFKNCEISVDGYTFQKNVEPSHASSYSCISTDEKCIMDFETCTIKRVSFTLNARTGYSSFEGANNLFLSGGAGTKLLINNCKFEGSYYGFYSGGNESSVEIRHSNVNWVAEELKTSPVGGNHRKFLSSSYITISDTNICEIEKIGDIKNALLEAEERLLIEKCQFVGCSYLFFDIANTEIKYSEFKNCIIAIEKVFGNKKDDNILFDNCVLQDCIFPKADTRYVMCFENSKFLNCIGQLPIKYMKDIILEGGYLYLDTHSDIELTNCKFYNWSYKLCENRFGITNQKAVMCVGDGSKFVGCHFENFDLENVSVFAGNSQNPSMSCVIENCYFQNIKTNKEVMNKQYKYYQEGLFKGKWLTGRVNFDIRNSMGV